MATPRDVTAVEYREVLVAAVELRQLKYFVEIARHGSFSTAAMRIRVAQPALSTQIANLEKEIGQPLFTRHARGVRLTDAGELLLDHAIAILQRVDEARLAMRSKTVRGPVEITLGVPPSISMMLTVPLVEMVTRDLPGVSLKIVEQMSGALRGWLDDKTIDMAFLHNVDSAEFPDAVPIVSEELFAATSATSGIALSSDMHVRDLIKLPLIASTRRNNHRMLLEKLARMYHSPLTIVAEVDSIPRQRELVRRGTGTLIMSLSGYSDWPKDGIQFARVHGEGLAWDTSLVSSGSPAGREAMAILAPLIVSLTRDLVEAGEWPGAIEKAIA